MPIRRIREYMDAPVLTSGFSPARREILVEHRKTMLDQIRELHEALLLIDRKIELYDTTGLGCAPQMELSMEAQEAVAH